MTKYLLFRWRVAELVAEVVQEGYDVIFTAIGKVWLKDAVPALQQVPDSDLQVRCSHGWMEFGFHCFRTHGSNGVQGARLV